MSATERKPLFLLELADRRGTFIYGSHVPTASEDDYDKNVRLYIGESGRMQRLELTRRWAVRNGQSFYQTSGGFLEYGHGLYALWVERDRSQHDLLIHRLSDCEVTEADDQVTFTAVVPSVHELVVPLLAYASDMEALLARIPMVICSDAWPFSVPGAITEYFGDAPATVLFLAPMNDFGSTDYVSELKPQK